MPLGKREGSTRAGRKSCLGFQEGDPEARWTSRLVKCVKAANLGKWSPLDSVCAPSSPTQPPGKVLCWDSTPLLPTFLAPVCEMPAHLQVASPWGSELCLGPAAALPSPTGAEDSGIHSSCFLSTCLVRGTVQGLRMQMRF